MSITAYQKMIRSIAEACSDFPELHGHGLRHAWNRRFSELMDSMDDPPTPEEQEKVRSYLQGWKPSSGTGGTYNRRFVERKAMEASLKLQQGTTRIPENLKNDQ
jgi:integrase